MAHQRRDDNAVWTMWTRWEEVPDEGQKEKEEPAGEEAEATEEERQVAL